MKTNKISSILVIFISLFFGLTACTKQAVKNKALVLAIEKFDNEIQADSKMHFVDQEQQKVFADFKKKNTKIAIESFEMKGDTEATAQLSIETFPKTIVEELKTISGKDWKAKVDAAKEKKTYTLQLQKVDNVWKIISQTENTP